MRIAFLTTSSNEVRKYSDSMACLNPSEVLYLCYDTPEHVEQELIRKVKEFAPAFVVYIGSRWGAVLTVHALAHINHHIAPAVHICSDAADPPWWDLLREYNHGGAFALQVAIDGSRKWPPSESPACMTALTPVIADNFTLNGHDRSIPCGYAGNPGSEGSIRRTILSQLIQNNSIQARLRDDEPDSYRAYCNYLMSCRMVINLPHTGTQAAMHVKGRILEAGLAGCCVLEMKGSPTENWFVPDHDYLVYRDADHARKLISETPPEAAAAMGRRLREKILANHAPLHFWTRILDRIGVRG